MNITMKFMLLSFICLIGIEISAMRCTNNLRRQLVLKSRQHCTCRTLKSKQNKQSWFDELTSFSSILGLCTAWGIASYVVYLDEKHRKITTSK